MSRKIIILFLMLGFSMFVLPSESNAAVNNEPTKSVNIATPGSAAAFQRNRWRRERRWDRRRDRRERRWDRRQNRRERRWDRRENRRDRRWDRRERRRDRRN